MHVSYCSSLVLNAAPPVGNGFCIAGPFAFEVDNPFAGSDNSSCSAYGSMIFEVTIKNQDYRHKHGIVICNKMFLLLQNYISLMDMILIVHVVLLLSMGQLVLYRVRKSSRCNTFEDWAHVDFIWGWPIFKSVAGTWIECTRILVPMVVAGATFPIFVKIMTATVTCDWLCPKRFTEHMNTILIEIDHIQHVCYQAAHFVNPSCYSICWIIYHQTIPHRYMISFDGTNAVSKIEAFHSHVLWSLKAAFGWSKLVPVIVPCLY